VRLSKSHQKTAGDAAESPAASAPARLLSHVQQGFQAFMDGESYLQQRQQALEGRSPAAAVPPSLVDKVRGSNS
jgi:hypothetical protein